MGVTFQRRPSLPHPVADRQPSVEHDGILERFFYFFMALLIALVVAYGFSRTVNAGLIHPPSPRPTVLYLHAMIFTAWVALFIVLILKNSEESGPAASIQTQCNLLTVVF